VTDPGRLDPRADDYFNRLPDWQQELCLRDHVNLFLYDPIAPDPHGIVTRGQENKTGRQIMFFEGDPIPVGPLTELLREIVANNRAGGWRKLTGA